MKSFIWIGVITMVLIGVLFWAVSGSAIKPAFEAGVVHPLDNVKGNASSSVVIVEYSDFECPACRAYYLLTKQLAVEFGDRAAFVYRHFPLIEIHKNAEPAARAAQAAGKQGKFWEMHDLLFEKQSEWSESSNPESFFEAYAGLLGVSIEQFKADYSSGEVKNFVRTQRTNAIKLRLQGTPSFFINGKQIQNPRSVEEFRAQINTALRGE